ncbi:MAG: TIGR02147 family protein [Bdellovibrionales bacterium]|nr:TIGR02147 family protein [Bdellovibrionales bacterium]
MNLFKYEDYKSYIKDRIQQMPRKGRGQLRQLAMHLGVSTVQVSHVFTGDRELNPELALEVASYFELKSLETEYFVLLVQKARAGTHRLKQHYNQQLSVVRQEGLSTGYRLEGAKVITEEVKLEYYTNVLHSLVRLVLLLDSVNGISEIAQRLHLSEQEAQTSLDFLLRYGFCEKVKGQIKVKDPVLYLPPDSPLVAQQHIHWRLRGMEKVRFLSDEELFFSGPVTLAKQDLPRIKEEIKNFIAQFMNSIKDSKDEDLACLNIDWFKI